MSSFWRGAATTTGLGTRTSELRIMSFSRNGQHCFKISTNSYLILLYCLYLLFERFDCWNLQYSLKLLVYFSSFQCSPFDFQSLISLQPTISNESSVASFIVVNASYQWPYAAVRSLFAVDLAQQLSAWRFLERCSSRRGNLKTWTKFRKNFRERVSRLDC